jgi:hypothetical protein
LDTRPPLILGAAVREVDGAVGRDVEIVGEAQRDAIDGVGEHRGLASLGADSHQTEVRIGDVEVS